MKFSSLLPFLTPHRRILVTLVALLLGSSALALTQPWLAGQLTGLLLAPQGTLWTVQQLLLAWVALIITRGIIDFSAQYYAGSTSEQMSANLRSRLHDHMQALPLDYFEQRRSGDLLALLSNDSDIISGFVTDTVVQLLPLILTFCGAFVLMLFIEPLIAGLAVALLAIYFLAMKFVGRGIRPLSRAWIDAYSGLLTFLDENLDMMPAIKSFVREAIERKRFEEHNARLLRLSNRQLFTQAALSQSVGLLSGLGLMLLLWLGYSRIAAGELTPPELVSLLLYSLLMIQPIKGLANVYGLWQRSMGAAERVMEFLDVQPEPADTGKRALPTVKGDIRFEQVHFHYPGGKPVLTGLDLTISAGETVAIIGPNGAGKTTLAHLLMRFSSPQAGCISIDGVDIAQVSLGSLRRQIGLVAQHSLLANGTVAENIAYGAPPTTRDTVEHAARQAGAHPFISALPQGYQTPIGEKGIRLSGGQRQSLALARTLLLDPPIVILDEATSMFDGEGDEAFSQRAKAIFKNKTVIVISHRLSGLAFADRTLDLGHCQRPGR